MSGLPDILSSHMSVLFCGMVATDCAAVRGHHYSGRGDAFWQLIHDAGLTPRRLTPQQDASLSRHGLGVTTLTTRGAEDRTGPVDVPFLVAKVIRCRPVWLAFTGKGTAGLVARELGEAHPALGTQRWTVGDSNVFVLPSSSSANQRKDYDGRPHRLDWWAELGGLVRSGVDQPDPPVCDGA